MITSQQLAELITVIMQDCPLPPVETVLASVSCPEDIDVMLGFLHRNYAKREIMQGINNHMNAIRKMTELFGAKNETT